MSGCLSAIEKNVLPCVNIQAPLCLVYQRYDTVYFRALKTWRDGQLSLAHGTETEKIRKKKQKPSISEERTGQIREGNPGGRIETTVCGTCRFQAGSEREGVMDE